jgi:hypothetical protein
MRASGDTLHLLVGEDASAQLWAFRLPGSEGVDAEDDANDTNSANGTNSTADGLDAAVPRPRPASPWSHLGSLTLGGELTVNGSSSVTAAAIRDKYIVTGHASGVVVLWSRATLLPVFTLTGEHSAPILAVGWAHERDIVSIDGDNVLVRWRCVKQDGVWSASQEHEDPFVWDEQQGIMLPVYLTLDGVSWHTGPKAQVRIHPAIVVTSVFPSWCPLDGGHTIVIRGYHIPETPRLACRFGLGLPLALAIYISPNEVHCTCPSARALDDQFAAGEDPVLPWHTDMKLELTANQVEYVQAFQGFSYFSAPKIDRVWPVTGPSDGFEVVLYISGWHPQMQPEGLFCEFKVLTSSGGAQSVLKSEITSALSPVIPRGNLSVPCRMPRLSMPLHFSESIGVVVSLQSSELANAAAAGTKSSPVTLVPAVVDVFQQSRGRGNTRKDQQSKGYLESLVATETPYLARHHASSGEPVYNILSKPSGAPGKVHLTSVKASILATVVSAFGEEEPCWPREPFFFVPEHSSILSREGCADVCGRNSACKGYAFCDGRAACPGRSCGILLQGPPVNGTVVEENATIPGESCYLKQGHTVVLTALDTGAELSRLPLSGSTVADASLLGDWVAVLQGPDGFLSVWSASSGTLVLDLPDALQPSVVRRLKGGGKQHRRRAAPRLTTTKTTTETTTTSTTTTPLGERALGDQTGGVALGRGPHSELRLAVGGLKGRVVIYEVEGEANCKHSKSCSLSATELSAFTLEDIDIVDTLDIVDAQFAQESDLLVVHSRNESGDDIYVVNVTNGDSWLVMHGLPRLVSLDVEKALPLPNSTGSVRMISIIGTGLRSQPIRL